MNKFEIEWAHYLEAFRLHQGLTKASNLETRTLLRKSMDVSRKNSRYIPRSYGLLSFTILNAWLSNWITESEAVDLAVEAIADIGHLGDATGSLSGILESLNAVRQGELQIDESVRTVVFSYATVAFELDSTDFENHWSLATANLYKRNFAEAVNRYDEALALARETDWPPIGQNSLSVDIADTRFFVGSRDLEDSDEAYMASIRDGIAMTEKAIADSPNDSKRHRWYWTLGWAYYELGGYADIDREKIYASSLEVLQKIRTPHGLIRKNLIASYVALEAFEPARALAEEFMANNEGYTLDVENRWPYRSERQLERWKDHLRIGGLPDR